MNRIIAAVLKGAGLCLAVSIAAAVRAGAQDGDSIYSTFDDTHNVYRGGTGKYAGITGTFDGCQPTAM